MIPVERLRTLAIRKPVKELVDLFGDYYSPYYSFFYYLTQHIKEGTCLELGVEQGRGCYSLALGSDKVNVTGLDTEVKVQYRHTNFKFMRRASLPAFALPDISILHIDTEHSYAMAQAEFEGWKPYLVKGAVVCFDDLHAMNDGVLNYFNSLPYKRFVMDDLHPICGFGVLIYEGK